MILAIDWDRTLHDADHPVPGRKLGPPLPGAKDALIHLVESGHTVIIHSCGRPSVIADWLAYFEIPYSSLWCGEGKPQADCYIDDRGLHHVSWEHTMDELRRRREGKET